VKREEVKILWSAAFVGAVAGGGRMQWQIVHPRDVSQACRRKEPSSDSFVDLLFRSPVFLPSTFCD
jgi:hypothetical protein